MATPAKIRIDKKKSWGFFSPLMRRILAVNVVALVILGGGILYLNQFQENLLEQRAAELRNDALIIAGALGESQSLGPESTEIDVFPARQIVDRLVGPNSTRARLFSNDGSLILDSRYIDPNRSILILPLPDPNLEKPLGRKIVDWINGKLDDLTLDPALEPYIEPPIQTADDFPEVWNGLAGETDVVIRTLPDGNFLISVSTPIQRFRRVLGSLMLTDDTADIKRIVYEERVTILKIFGMSFGVTLFLSIFLAGTIARPIHRLAGAADDVRRGQGGSEKLKRFSGRRDEIGALSRSLSEMTDALHRQINAVESFAADVAHELKNPLSSLRSAVETVARTDDEKIQRRLLAIIQEDVKRLDRLITDISDASRLDAELSRGNMEAVDFGLLVQTIVEAYEATGKNKTPEMVFKEPKAGTYMVNGLQTRLGQVVYNLLDNAISFTPKKGKITLRLLKKKGILEFSVSDEGPGLPPEAGEKIFNRFYSERPKSEAFGTHSGLGLSICRQIVEAHGGTIEAVNIYKPGTKSKSGKNEAPKSIGARFVVRLPI